MSTLQLQKIQQKLLTLSSKDLQDFIAELMSKAQTKDEIPERDATPEEAKIIDEYRKNPQLLSAEETKNFLQSLRMKI